MLAKVFIWLILMFVCIKRAASQNAELTAMPLTVSLGGSITLFCKYTGIKNVTAVYWFKGSFESPLILKPDLEVNKCDVFSSESSLLFNLSGLNFTCNSQSNMYSLFISQVLKEEDNVTWSCEFSDPALNYKRANFTLHVKGTECGNGGIGVGMQNETIAAIVVSFIMVAMIIAAVIAVLFFRCKKIRANFCTSTDATTGKTTDNNQLERGNEQQIQLLNNKSL